MLNLIRSISNSINQPRRKYKILATPTHEGFQSMLAATDHEFHFLQGQGIKRWDFHTRPLPPNCFIHTEDASSFRGDVQFDIILSQQRYNELQRFAPLGKQHGIPVIHIDHTEPPPGTPEKRIGKLAAMRADKHVFITEHNKSTWGGHESDTVIPHGIDTNIFESCYTRSHGGGISVVNHFATRDIFCGWELFKRVAEAVPMRLIGENPGLSKSINDPKLLAQAIGSSAFFLNTSQLSPVPLSLLEAASTGTPIVSTAKQEVPKIFTHNVNALLTNDPDEMIKYCQMLIENPEEGKRLGAAARELILNQYSIERFVNRWNTVFDEVVDNHRGVKQ